MVDLRKFNGKFSKEKMEKYQMLKYKNENGPHPCVLKIENSEDKKKIKEKRLDGEGTHSSASPLHASVCKKS